MADPQRQIASRHHTNSEQVQACCRILAKNGEALLDELDDSEDADRLRSLVCALRRAGAELPGNHQGPVLRLLRSPE